MSRTRLLTLTNAQNQEILLSLNEEDNFLIQYDIWESEIEITDVWANTLSILVLLSDAFLDSIKERIVTQLHQDDENNRNAALAA